MAHHRPEDTFAWFLSLIAARTLLVLLCVTLGLRLLGKRQIGQVNIYDLAMVMAVANAVQNAMTSGNGNLSVGIVSSATLLLAGRLVAVALVRLPGLERVLAGVPTVLIKDGKLLEENLRREHVTREQVRMALRQYGLEHVREVSLAVLEVDGTLSIVPRDAERDAERDTEPTA